MAQDERQPVSNPEEEAERLPLFEKLAGKKQENERPPGQDAPAQPKEASPLAASSRRSVLTPDEEAQIRRLQSQGLGSRRIAKAVGRSRKTVRRVLEMKASSTPVKPTATATKLDSFRELVREKVGHKLTVTRILRELKEQGYTGGRTILAEYVRTLRSPLAPRARRITRRFETELGEEIQVDWSTYRVLVGGALCVVHALAMVLAHSRQAFLRFFRSQRQPCLLEGLAAGLEHFGGSTRKLVFDNMATVVLGRVGRDRTPLWNRELVAFARHYGFEPWLCRVADPNRKGEVEAFLGYAERDFVRGRSAASLAELNREADLWLRTVANRRRHGTTGRVPEEAWAEERPFLIPLPETSYPGMCEIEYRQVAEDSTISVRGTRYTVPWRLAHKQVRVRLYSERFEVLDREGRVALGRAYAVGPEAQRLQLNPAHYEDLPRSRGGQGGKTRRLKEQLVLRWPAAEPFVDGLHAHVKSLLHVHLRRLLSLAERYGDEALGNAMATAHAAGRHTANAVDRILERNHEEPCIEPLPLQGGAAHADALLGDLPEGSLDDFGYLDDLAAPASAEDHDVA